MKRIQSKLLRTGTYNVCKISLSCFDDKRYVLDDGVNTLVYFHKDIKNDEIGEIDRIDEIDKRLMGLIKD